MATKDSRIKAKLKDGITEVKVMASHDMLSYVEAKNKKTEANFITYLVAKVNGKIVYEVSTSQFLSKDPYLKFSFKGAKDGDEIEVYWKDLKGEENTSKAKIK